MKLQPKQDAPKTDYPSYEAHRLSRRGMVGGAAAVLLAQGCSPPQPLGECPPAAHPAAETNAPVPTVEETSITTEPIVMRKRKPFRTRGLVGPPKPPEKKTTIKTPAIAEHEMLPAKHPTTKQLNIEEPNIDHPELPAVDPDPIDLSTYDTPAMPGFIIQPSPPGAATNSPGVIRLPGEVVLPEPPTP